MNDRDFYELCYEQYKREMDQADALYQRAGVLLAALPLLGAIIYGLGRADLIPRVFERVDIFLYYLATTASLALLGVSALYLILSIHPQKYPSLASMKKWQEWRDKLRKHFGAEDKSTPAEDKISNEMLRSIIPLLADAEGRCAQINERRRKQFKWSIRTAGTVVAGIAVQAAFRLLLHLQDI